MRVPQPAQASLQYVPLQFCQPQPRARQQLFDEDATTEDDDADSVHPFSNSQTDFDFATDNDSERLCEWFVSSSIMLIPSYASTLQT